MAIKFKIMKKILLCFLVLASFNAKAQTVDAAIRKIIDSSTNSIKVANLKSIDSAIIKQRQITIGDSSDFTVTNIDANTTKVALTANTKSAIVSILTSITNITILKTQVLTLQTQLTAILTQLTQLTTALPRITALENKPLPKAVTTLSP